MQATWSQHGRGRNGQILFIGNKLLFPLCPGNCAYSPKSKLKFQLMWKLKHHFCWSWKLNFGSWATFSDRAAKKCFSSSSGIANRRMLRILKLKFFVCLRIQHEQKIHHELNKAPSACRWQHRSRYSLWCFKRKNLWREKQLIFYLAQVLPSNVELTSDKT